MESPEGHVLEIRVPGPRHGKTRSGIRRQQQESPTFQRRPSRYVEVAASIGLLQHNLLVKLIASQPTATPCKYRQHIDKTLRPRTHSEKAISIAAEVFRSIYHSVHVFIILVAQPFPRAVPRTPRFPRQPKKHENRRPQQIHEKTDASGEFQTKGPRARSTAASSLILDSTILVARSPPGHMP